jgi:hypothetical protein
MKIIFYQTLILYLTFYRSYVHLKSSVAYPDEFRLNPDPTFLNVRILIRILSKINAGSGSAALSKIVEGFMTLFIARAFKRFLIVEIRSVYKIERSEINDLAYRR